MKIINLIKFFIIITFLSSSLHAADDGHDHDHAAHSDEPFYGHVGIRVHADHVNDAGEGEEEVNEYYTHSPVSYTHLTLPTILLV